MLPSGCIMSPLGQRPSGGIMQPSSSIICVPGADNVALGRHNVSLGRYIFPYPWGGGGILYHYRPIPHSIHLILSIHLEASVQSKANEPLFPSLRLQPVGDDPTLRNPWQLHCSCVSYAYIPTFQSDQWTPISLPLSTVYIAEFARK